jgi:FlaA1/EpsC-like NDP-sugar epimerase
VLTAGTRPELFICVQITQQRTRNESQQEKSMGQLDGKIAIVTGGGSGIGKGIAKAFVDEGCAVVIAARNGDRLNAAARLRQLYIC